MEVIELDGKHWVASHGSTGTMMASLRTATSTIAYACR